MGLMRILNLYILVIIWPETKGSALSEFINRYEVLKYDIHEVQSHHHRIKRSLSNEYEPLSIRFDSHGKYFHIRLKRDTETISPSVQVDLPSHLGELDTSHLYEGTLADDPRASVYGSIRNGVFEGVVEGTRNGTYYIEGARKYFSPSDIAEKGFHSVIYHSSEVKSPHRGRPGGCGLDQDVADWMDAVQNSAVPDPEDKDDGDGDAFLEEEEGDYDFLMGNKPRLTQAEGREDVYNRHHKYSQEANRVRKKRAVFPAVGENNMGTCVLSIQTDPMLWEHIRRREENDIQTRDEITSMISQHIKAINNIYGNVMFDRGKYKHKGIRFEVQRIKIDDKSRCNSRRGSREETYKFCKPNLDVSNFLNLHSQENHDDFCLAYVFTYRDFTGGTLGLAWVASPSGASGGICEKYKTYTENLAGLRHTEDRSLNTGIITFLNYNSPVPPKVSQLTLAHEIGHNFGSPHDFPSSCKPGGLEGNFIMFSSATSGDRPNNSKFSHCSIHNISNVLDAISENRRKNCFKKTNGTFCGNKIVEAGEECDCGYDEQECTEQCCYPRLLTPAMRQANSSARQCARRANTQCSPSEGPCCNRRNCGFVSDMVCHRESDCTEETRCNGLSAYCQKPIPKPDKIFCNENTKVCLNGECSGSICLSKSMNECFLTSDKVTDKKKLCEIACQRGNNASSCQSTSELSEFFEEPVFMRPGAPCNNFQGYCDVFQKCRAVDAEGPLARLKNLLFSQDTLNSVAEWITNYWYAVLFVGVFFVVFMGLFIKCCAVHTPSSNPRKPPARSISETLRRPVNTLRRVKRHRQGPGPSGQGGGPSHRHHHHHHHHPSPQRQQQPPPQQLQQHQLQSQPGPSRRQQDGGGREQQNRQHGGRKGGRGAKRGSQGYSTDDPPPPYPGNHVPPYLNSQAPPPTRHGYGEGRGHYNRPRGGRQQENSAV